MEMDPGVQHHDQHDVKDEPGMARDIGTPLTLLRNLVVQVAMHSYSYKPEIARSCQSWTDCADGRNCQTDSDPATNVSVTEVWYNYVGCGARCL